MTRKQRAKIYRKAAKLIDDLNSDMLFGCEAIRRQLGKEKQDVKFSEMIKSFPEFLMFEFGADEGVWWNTGDSAEDFPPRILALLLSEQMALNP